MPRMRLWDSLLLTYADKALDTNIVGFSFLRVLQEKQRADERTRTAHLLITSLLAYMLAGTGAPGFQLDYAGFRHFWRKS